MSDRTPLKTDTLASGIAMLLALTVAQRLIGFARGVLFCRWLDSDQLGQWDLAYGFLMLAAPLAVLGLPGSLGRYAEYYRQRGSIKRFLRQVVTGTAFVAGLSVAIVVWRRDWFAEALFSRSDQADFVSVLAIVLATWIFHTLLVALFNALRMTRVVSALQFCHSLGFAVIGVGLLFCGQASAAGVLWSFAGASALSSTLGIVWLANSWSRLPELPPDSDGTRWDLWKQILPFALWVWITNALANTFGLADRWMIIHFSGLSEPEALAQLGQYHSARIVPILFLGIAEMFAGLVTPHLAYDWEGGRREQVARRLNFILKSFSLCLFAASAALLVASPLLFGVALAGKYATGMALLPWTLMYCIWGSLAVVATNYLWCAERAKLACLSILLGLIINVALGAWLLPRYGLHGAAWGTSVANFAILGALHIAAWTCGMRFDRGVFLAALAPLALLAGPGAALSVLFLFAVLAWRTSWLLTADEQRHLIETLRHFTRRFIKNKATALQHEDQHVRPNTAIG
ncbi:MAG: lipopolysaccharide biosynthesis protein [Pirellulales bacterium]